jgi:hypothetical protein
MTLPPDRGKKRVFLKKENVFFFIMYRYLLTVLGDTVPSFTEYSCGSPWSALL